MRAGPFVILLVMATAGPAAAQPFPTVTDRDYAIDLYTGVALGNGRIVAMGGAAVAYAEGSAGTIVNAAAPAVRPATSTDSWDWDFHFDYLSSVKASDWDNNGIEGGEGSGVVLFTFGLAGMWQDWGLAVVLNQQSIDLSGASSGLQAQVLQGKLALARSFLGEAITVGLGVRIGQFSVQNGTQDQFQIAGSSLEAGALWRPYLGDLRIGATFALPVTGTDVTSPGCDPMSCNGYILPERVEAPWQIAVGGAYRFGPTRWNQWVGGNWRDEPSLTLAADVLITGSSPDAFGLEAFAEHQLQRSGRDVVYGFRAGAEYEWLPGRLRVRAGSYWEPGRFLDETGDQVGGRIHATFGLDVRVLQFDLWGKRRGRISATGDLASQYANIGASIGFWH